MIIVEKWMTQTTHVKNVCEQCGHMFNEVFAYGDQEAHSDIKYYLLCRLCMDQDTMCKMYKERDKYTGRQKIVN